MTLGWRVRKPTIQQTWKSTLLRLRLGRAKSYPLTPIFADFRGEGNRKAGARYDGLPPICATGMNFQA